MTGVDFLSELYPPERLLTRPAQLAAYESDALTALRARPKAVVIPETQAEVIETVRLCYRYHVPFVARGSGTRTKFAHSASTTRRTWPPARRRCIPRSEPRRPGGGCRGCPR